MLRIMKGFIKLLLIASLFSSNAWANDTIQGKRIAAGWWSSLFIDSSGTLWAWGSASIKEDGLRPEPVMSDAQTVSASSGATYSMVIRKDGSLWGWGSSDDGELGVKLNIKARWVEEPIQILPAVRRIEAGNNVVFAIKPDGSLWTWGQWGERRGDNSKKSRTTPRKILSKVKQVSTSQYHTLAVREDGSLWAWGYNNCGALGDGTRRDHYRPRKVNLKNLKGRQIISIANSVGDSFAVTDDGLVWRWGERHYFHEWCIGKPLLLIPTRVKEIEGAQDIVTGWYGLLMLKKDGTVWEWGTRGGDFLDSPTQVMSDAQEIAAGERHFLVLKKDGTVWAWGMNDAGQLGDGTKEDRREPKQVVFPK